MYAPPPLGYAWIVCRYEKTTIARSVAMSEADRRGERERRRAADDQHAQDFFGRVRDRRQRVGREHREARDPGQPFVMREV